MPTVLVITALQEELDAVLRLKERGADDWNLKTIAGGYLYYETEFLDTNDNAFNVVASSQSAKGMVGSVLHTARMLSGYPVVDFAFMSGICAGRRQKGVSLGDVIAGDLAFHYEVGKKTVRGFEPETVTNKPDSRIIQWLHDFNSRPFPWGQSIARTRPPTLRFQKEWILFKLEHQPPNRIWPTTDEDFDEARRKCPSWKQAISALSALGLIEQASGLTLTEGGRQEIARLKIEGLTTAAVPDSSSPKVWIGAFATGSAVVAVPNFFDELAKHERTVLALDMEADAFLQTVREHSPNIPCVVIKGVCDFADNEKDDAFHSYAAQAAATWMLEFVRYALPLTSPAASRQETQTVVPELGAPTTQSGLLYESSVIALYMGRLCDSTSRPDNERIKEVLIGTPIGTEDLVVTFADGHCKFIQAKENVRDNDSAWVKLWKDFESLFSEARFHRGRDRIVLHTAEARSQHDDVRKLCEQAYQAVDYDKWIATLNSPERDLLSKTRSSLSPALSNDPELLLSFFKHIDIEISSLTQIERDIVPRFMPPSNEPAIKLFRLLRDRVGDAARNRTELRQGDLRATLAIEDKIDFEPQPEPEDLIKRISQCGAVLRQHKHFFGTTGKHIKRAVVDDISQWALEIDTEDNLALLMDQAGMGKTIVARDVLLELEESGVPVLAIKADQQLSGISEAEDLRLKLQLPDAPERILERVAADGRVVVLIDQIDALSLSMARDQRALNIVLDLVARLRLVPNVRTILSCRAFDLNNDPRLKRLDVKRRFTIPELTTQEVEDVLNPIGIELCSLARATQKLLKTPLNLDLFVLATDSMRAIDDEPTLQHIVNLQDLYTLLWTNVVRKASGEAPNVADREAAIGLLADYMNQHQRISAPHSILATKDLQDAADWLASEGILISSQTEWSFLHQTFFDYCYAKRFVESGASLSELVLQGDQGLFARPQIIQVLTYLRGLSPQTYLHELSELLTARTLRAHLHDLVVRWYGALPNPSADEWLIARRLLVDRLSRARILTAMAGNRAWFNYLKQSVLPDSLNDESIVDSLIIPYLTSMLGEEEKEVIRLVKPYIDRGDNWKRRIRWILESIRSWNSSEAIDLFVLVFASAASSEVKNFYQLDDIARVDPQAGARLVQQAFNKVLDEYACTREQEDKPRLFSLSTHLEQFNGSTIDNALNEVSQKEPEYFLDLMIPWIERVVDLTAYDDDSSPFYGSDEFSYLGWYGDGFVVKHQLIEAYVSALTLVGRNNPDQFRQIVARLGGSSGTTPQRFLAHAFRNLAEVYAHDALKFLTADNRRLELGDHDQYDSRQLIAAIYPHLSSAERVELVDAILSFDYIRKYAGVHGLKWRGLEQLYLLQAIPRDLLTDRGERRLQQWERKFPNVKASKSPTTVRGGFVGPPINEAQARLMSDKAWLRAMKKYRGEITHKHDFLKGGARELGGVLLTLTKEDPGRFYRLALRLPADTDDAYVQAIMTGLAESNGPAELLFNVIRRFSPQEGRDIRSVIARGVEKRVKDDVPDDIVKLITSYVRGPHSADEDWWKQRDKESGAGLNEGPYSSYLNSDRGAAFTTLIRILDEKGTSESKNLKWALIESIAQDTSTALRAGAIEALLYLVSEDRARAVSIFELLMEGHPALLRSYFTQEFLRYGLYRYYRKMKPFILALMNSEHESLQQRGAELACIAAISPEALDSEDERSDAAELAESALHGLITWRRGAARVYAANITSDVGEFCTPRLLLLLKDEDEEVQQFISGVFHGLSDSDFMRLRDFTLAYAQARPLSREMYWFTEFLWQHGMLDPFFSLSVLEAMLAGSADVTTLDPSLRFLRGGEELVRLTLAIYTHPGAKEAWRNRAMDVFDKLMNIFAGQALSVLSEWDRR